MALCAAESSARRGEPGVASGPVVSGRRRQSRDRKAGLSAWTPPWSPEPDGFAAGVEAARVAARAATSSTPPPPPPLRQLYPAPRRVEATPVLETKGGSRKEVSRATRSRVGGRIRDSDRLGRRSRDRLGSRFRERLRSRLRDRLGRRFRERVGSKFRKRPGSMFLAGLPSRLQARLGRRFRERLERRFSAGLPRRLAAPTDRAPEAGFLAAAAPRHLTGHAFVATIFRCRRSERRQFDAVVPKWRDFDAVEPKKRRGRHTPDLGQPARVADSGFRVRVARRAGGGAPRPPHRRHRAMTFGRQRCRRLVNTPAT